MIPNRINLLSPEKRRHLRSMVYFQFLKSILEIFLVILSIAGIILLGAQSVLESYFSDLTETITFTQKQYSQTNRDVKNINQTLNEIFKIQKEYQSVTDLTSLFSSSVPPEITLSTVSIGVAAKTLTLTGTAKTRESLLKFETQLKQQDKIAQVDLPISQLTKKEDLPFIINAKLK